jgi:hypothetical protein
VNRYRRRTISVVVTLSCALAAASALPSRGGVELTVEELLAKHLASIGAQEARTAARARMALGHCNDSKTAQATLACSPVLLSQGNSLRMFEETSVQFAFDGWNLSQTETMKREPSFFAAHFEEAFDAGLVGGTLSTSWPLLDFDAHKTELKYEGLQAPSHFMSNLSCSKVAPSLEDIGAGAVLHKVTFHPREKSWDMRAALYFEPGSFRHVQTVYISGKRMFWEVFSDFREVDGLTLPYSWSLRSCACFETSSRVGQAVPLPVAPEERPPRALKLPGDPGTRPGVPETPPASIQAVPKEPKQSSLGVVSRSTVVHNLQFLTIKHNRKFAASTFIIQ